jgi:hypothetical protein
MMPNIDPANIGRVAYDGRSRLFVTFNDSGDSYTYYAVPVPVYEDMIASESIPSFFRRRIQNRYSSRKRESLDH